MTLEQRARILATATARGDLTDVIAAYHAKCAANRARRWPDWRDSDASQPIEHIRDEATS